MNEVQDRIRYLRKTLLGLNQAAFGRLAGVTKQAVSNWERGIAVPDRHALKALARLKRINGDWVTDGVGEVFLRAAVFENTDRYDVDPASQLRNQLPLIPWEEAAGWDATRADTAADSTLVRTSRPFSWASFALQITGDAMEASGGISFPVGAIICVDPAMQAKDGSYVIIGLDAGAVVTFRQLVFDGGRRYMKPLNLRYPITEADERAVVVGVVRQMILDLG